MERQRGCSRPVFLVRSTLNGGIVETEGCKARAGPGLPLVLEWWPLARLSRDGPSVGNARALALWNSCWRSSCGLSDTRLESNLSPRHTDTFVCRVLEQQELHTVQEKGRPTVGWCFQVRMRGGTILPCLQAKRPSARLCLAFDAAGACSFRVPAVPFGALSPGSPRCFSAFKGSTAGVQALLAAAGSGASARIAVCRASRTHGSFLSKHPRCIRATTSGPRSHTHGVCKLRLQ